MNKDLISGALEHIRDELEEAIECGGLIEVVDEEITTTLSAVNDAIAKVNENNASDEDVKSYVTDAVDLAEPLNNQYMRNESSYTDYSKELNTLKGVEDELSS